MTLLVPERMLVFSPALAATIGLEEAILLYQLHDLSATRSATHGNSPGLMSANSLELASANSPELASANSPELASANWCAVDIEILERVLPFWSRVDLQRIAGSLAAKGVVQIQPPLTDTCTQLRFSLASEPKPAAPSGAVQFRATPRSTRAPGTERPALSAGNAPAAAGRSLSGARSSLNIAGSTAGNASSITDIASSISSIAMNTPGIAAWSQTTASAPVVATGVVATGAAGLAARGASLLPANWQPQEDTLQLLALKNIPRQFAISQLEEFILYWRERGRAEYAWDNKFRKQVIERWQRSLQTGGAAEAEQPAATPDHVWYPSVDALQILERTGISREFIEDTIPEFVLYWRERGDSTGTWNSKFIAHIRRQWARYSNALEHDQEPRPIAPNWQPSEDVYDILRMANIDIQFACELLPEFILFWRDAGTVQRSWNTKFLQHIKYQWATRHHLTGATRAGYSLASGTGAQPPRSTFEQLTDRSWAVGLVDGI